MRPRVVIHKRRKMPDVVIAVGIARGACKQRPIGALSHVVISKEAVCDLPPNRMVFIVWLCFNRWPGRCERIIVSNQGIYIAVGCPMAALIHVEIQPRLVMDEGG